MSAGSWRGAGYRGGWRGCEIGGLPRGAGAGGETGRGVIWLDVGGGLLTKAIVWFCESKGDGPGTGDRIWPGLGEGPYSNNYTCALFTGYLHRLQQPPQKLRNQTADEQSRKF